MEHADNRSIALAYFTHWNAGDYDKCLELLSGDFRLEGKGMPGSGCDHLLDSEQLLNSARHYEGLFKKRITIEVERSIAEGDHVVLQARSSAILANDREYGNNYSFTVTLRHGKIVKIEEYCCTDTANRILRAHGISVDQHA